MRAASATFFVRTGLSESHPAHRVGAVITTFFVFGGSVAAGTGGGGADFHGSLGDTPALRTADCVPAFFSVVRGVTEAVFSAPGMTGGGGAPTVGLSLKKNSESTRYCGVVVDALGDTGPGFATAIVSFSTQPDADGTILTSRRSPGINGEPLGKGSKTPDSSSAGLLPICVTVPCRVSSALKRSLPANAAEISRLGRAAAFTPWGKKRVAALSALALPGATT